VRCRKAGSKGKRKNKRGAKLSLFLETTTFIGRRKWWKGASDVRKGGGITLPKKGGKARRFFTGGD